MNKKRFIVLAAVTLLALIAYSTGKISMPEMIKAGLLLDIIGAVLTIAMAYLLWQHLV